MLKKHIYMHILINTKNKNKNLAGKKKILILILRLIVIVITIRFAHNSFQLVPLNWYPGLRLKKLILRSGSIIVSLITKILFYLSIGIEVKQLCFGSEDTR